ncbi:prolipoprotein diacylglyceryl transferase [Candidatus Liberibacter americanus]|uniref:Phosphatidylglycerol--prolipoprotein diacylglyceryl transferase n=1 Tax=Candidatus Liberibacter americanus str. Sao Paulo TaxID=1261131 RepID=U6B3C4_9HYPH|nr:prolipoprotein diacylglyceryl transferase [Candidatus Liberibacter americanus]AHA27420.1 Prolipoprotein diacylglyceryltransferase [Candidatus Liberibacter americanus str. Sao Paulo]EMS36693.1 prolipoprotein diacylglyceryl transferase [Candidatus Liberibacter americanus PW_SP]
MLCFIWTYPSIDPVAISIPFLSISIRWYGLSYLFGILFSIWHIRNLLNRDTLWTARQNKENLVHINNDIQANCMLWMICGMIAGGRIVYMLFYNLGLLLDYPLRIFYIWEGGMSFHGGLIGVFVSILLFSRVNKISFWLFSDLIAVSAPFGLFLGRIANFINGELWGRVSWVPWAMVFPSGGSLPRHPSQLYEAFFEGIVLFFIMQLIVYCGALKRQSLATGVFISGYAIARIFMEFFREPDYQLGYILGGWLTMGMLLSLPMLIIGCIIIINAIRLERKDVY